MEYRENKRLNARVSLLGFGGMRFPTDGEGKIREAEAAGMLRRALEGGVNYFDTAHYYHDSQSEGFLGRALAGVPRDSYYLATKLPVWKVESVSDAQAIFDLQLERLHTGYFDFYLFHALDRKRWQAVKEQGLVEWAEELVRAGKIRRLGFSFHDSYEAFEEILTARQWDFCQLQLNYLDTEEQAGLKGYHLAERMGVPVVVMEPVKGGAAGRPAGGGGGAAPRRPAGADSRRLGPSVGCQPAGCAHRPQRHGQHGPGGGEPGHLCRLHPPGAGGDGTAGPGGR